MEEHNKSIDALVISCPYPEKESNIVFAKYAIIKEPSAPNNIPELIYIDLFFIPLVAAEIIPKIIETSRVSLKKIMKSFNIIVPLIFLVQFLGGTLQRTHIHRVLKDLRLL